MARKSICLVPDDWTLDIFRLHSCSDRSHHHISHAQLRRYQAQGVVRELYAGPERRIFNLRVSQNGAWITPRPVLHGRSSKLGEYVTLALAAKLLWARVMLADIRHCAVEEARDL
jgi:hypothetical protein